MNRVVKDFIERHVDALDNNLFESFYQDAYNELKKHELELLIQILKEADIDNYEVRKALLVDSLTYVIALLKRTGEEGYYNINTFIDDQLTSHHTTCIGFTKSEIKQIILENHFIWWDEFKIEIFNDPNGEFYFKFD